MTFPRQRQRVVRELSKELFYRFVPGRNRFHAAAANIFDAFKIQQVALHVQNVWLIRVLFQNGVNEIHCRRVLLTLEHFADCLNIGGIVAPGDSAFFTSRAGRRGIGICTHDFCG